ncbi:MULTISPECIES: hypothetical protein [Candidatus Nitrosocaldus]|jgi:hypothetical protein|uniref:Uncharacterized protein n=1 Tax=Candidatus Nitrosocaldus cavascurensis TaxID=2058097 RepID=A0A2K5ATA0_9ARCH|nr:MULTISPECIES: hypothetical protein [Candidatus Nitrosocaldus]SPC34857.1 protein of unknown function [Candidatus Nitrosocaldus cavascurensis]
MLSNKWLTIIGFTAIIITVTIIVSYNNKDKYLVTNDDVEVTDNLSLPPSYMIKKATLPPVKDIDEASTVVNYELPYPKYLPEGYSIQYIGAINVEGKDIWEVVIFAWDKEITDNTTNREFFYYGKGMVISISNNTKNSEAVIVDGVKEEGQEIGTALDELLAFYSKYGAHKLTIDGYQCVAYDSQIVEDAVGRKVPLLAEVDCLKGDLWIQIRAYLPESELVKVAESIL